VVTRAAKSGDGPHFFASGAEWRAWLERHHAMSTEVSVGFYKKATGRPSMTWQEAVDQALCFGWIDGVRHRIDDERYRQRFTPRKKGSNWSAVNIKRVKELTEQGLMAPAGLAAFAPRTPERSGVYSYENRPHELPPQYEKRIRANRAAWKFFQELPPGYRRTMIWWILSAKQDATRERRLASLIEHSAKGERIPLLPSAGSRKDAK
jgi:uncharacterized protein YdeI (YjbR/CyaY-like superfamily)